MLNASARNVITTLGIHQCPLLSLNTKNINFNKGSLLYIDCLWMHSDTQLDEYTNAQYYTIVYIELHEIHLYLNKKALAHKHYRSTVSFR